MRLSISKSMEVGNGLIINNDCLIAMEELIDQWIKIDAIITDTPYGTMNWAKLDWWENNKTSWDTAIEIKPLFEKCNKLLRMNWALILFSQEPYTSKLITQAHWNIPFNYRLIWKKDHFANALIAKKAPVSYFEDICVFTKEYDTEFNHPLRNYAINIINYIWKTKKEIFKEMGHQWICHFWRYDTLQFTLYTEKTHNQLIELYWIDKMDWYMNYEELKEIQKRFKKRFNLPEWQKFKSNILEYKKDYQGLHPTQKPVALMEDLIKTYTNEWELVLDFTMGSFTTAVASDNTNRKWIGIEMSEEYCKIWKERILKNRLENKQTKCI